MATRIDDLNAEIKAQGLAWTAGDTGVRGRIAPAGLIITPEEIALSKETADWLGRFGKPKRPKQVDWRAHEGHNWLSEVKDQGDYQSCAAFATLAAIEARKRYRAFAPRLDIDLSEAHLFKCGGGDPKVGWKISEALKFLRDQGGVVSEQDAPYEEMGQLDCDAVTGRKTRIKVYITVSTPSLRRKALAVNGPVIGTMEIYDDFLDYQSGIYSPSSTLHHGAHAVCVVGYDDVDKAWIIQNSWGTQWGENGFARIAYGACEIDRKFVFYDPLVK